MHELWKTAIIIPAPQTTRASSWGGNIKLRETRIKVTKGFGVLGKNMDFSTPLTNG